MDSEKGAKFPPSRRSSCRYRAASRRAFEKGALPVASQEFCLLTKLSIPDLARGGGAVVNKPSSPDGTSP